MEGVVMLAMILAVLVALGSGAWYGLVWTFPQLSRRYDVVWAGAGLFYALVLWVCAGQVTGAIALGQLIILALLGTLAYQVMQLRGGVTGEGVAVSQGMGTMALVGAVTGAVRSRVTGLVNKPDVVEEKTGETETPKAAPEASVPETDKTSADAKGLKASEASETKEGQDVKATEETQPEPAVQATATPSKKAPPKAATKPMPTGKGVYQRKKVRKFDSPEKTPAKKTGQPVYQRKRVRKFNDADAKPKTAEPKVAPPQATQPESAKPAPTLVPKPAPQPVPAGEFELGEATKAAVPETVAVRVDENFWETVAIAPESLLIPESQTTSSLPTLDDPWTTPLVDPEEFKLEVADISAVEAREPEVQPEPPPEPVKRSPRRKPTPMPQDSNWPDEDADSNWPDDDADSNWPDEQPTRRKPKPRRKSRPSVPVVEAEVVERSPRRPVILDAELVQDEDD